MAQGRYVTSSAGSCSVVSSSITCFSSSVARPCASRSSSFPEELSQRGGRTECAPSAVRIRCRNCAGVSSVGTAASEARQHKERMMGRACTYAL